MLFTTIKINYKDVITTVSEFWNLNEMGKLLAKYKVPKLTQVGNLGIIHLGIKLNP